MNYFCNEVYKNIDTASVEDMRQAIKFMHQRMDFNCKLCGQEDEGLCAYCERFFTLLICHYGCGNTYIMLDHKNPSIFRTPENFHCCVNCLEEDTHYHPIFDLNNAAVEEQSYDPLNTRKRKFYVKNLDWARKYLSDKTCDLDSYSLFMNFPVDSEFHMSILELCNFTKPENFVGYVFIRNKVRIEYKCKKEELFDWKYVTPRFFCTFLIILKRNKIPRCLRNFMLRFAI